MSHTRSECMHYYQRYGHFHVLVLDGRQCGNNLALCNFADVMELPNFLWMNCDLPATFNYNGLVLSDPIEIANSSNVLEISSHLK